MDVQTAVARKTGYSKVWIALKRTDLNDDRITVLREILIPRGADSSTAKQILFHSFGLSNATVLKMRNSHGSMIPVNSSLPVNNKHMPYVLEAVKVFQHIVPKPRTIAVTGINQSMKNRLQSITRRIERLEELVPEIKLRHQEKINQEMELLSQKMIFLNQRMQMADSHCWRGMFTRPPLW
ncbi:uncharacterized protein si:zfos-1056e6.1 [Acipenser ruthenus]|uniref:uncharacterized protein si:zfos-1056e6.1 n=1 Tax=Acipenser ruthenus TaxID=7906 RepID=UPI00145B048A|nr:uncharacterized protein si:zfos-1056e6.1 [Acipenser ruthenus]